MGRTSGTPPSNSAAAIKIREWRAKKAQAAAAKHKAKRTDAVTKRDSPAGQPALRVLGLDPWGGRLRQFQKWYRFQAAPQEKHMSRAEDMKRALRYPRPTSPAEVRAWLFALLAYWWLTPHSRDAIGYDLLKPTPEWGRVTANLRLSARAPRSGMSSVRRRGRGISCPKGDQAQREVATMRQWHTQVVADGGLEELTDADLEQPLPTTSTVARVLSALTSVGPYTTKSLLGTLTLAGRVHFDRGTIPPGSYSAVQYMLTGEPTLLTSSLWPWSPDPFDTHRSIADLAKLEGCSWQDMQCALCYWAPWRRYSSGRGTAESDSDGRPQVGGQR